MISNAPSSVPLVGAAAAPAITPDMVPAWGAERASVIKNTTLDLNNLAQQTLPLAAGLGIVGIMAYGLKTMVKGVAPSLLS